MFYLKIDYSWGDEEPEQKFTSFDEAWESAKKNGYERSRNRFNRT